MAQRLIIKGEGEISPIAMNNTVLGRAKNRIFEITSLNIEDNKYLLSFYGKRIRRSNDLSSKANNLIGF